MWRVGYVQFLSSSNFCIFDCFEHSMPALNENDGLSMLRTFQTSFQVVTSSAYTVTERLVSFFVMLGDCCHVPIHTAVYLVHHLLTFAQSLMLVFGYSSVQSRRNNTLLTGQHDTATFELSNCQTNCQTAKVTLGALV